MQKGLWKKGLVLGIILMFVGVGVIPSFGGTVLEKTTIMDSKSPGYIQDLIDNASEGDTINIPSGTYYENIVIYKSINLIGEDKNTTIIDGNNTEWRNVVNISADKVTVSGFTIQNSGNEWGDSGFDIFSNRSTITDNIISNNRDGISLGRSNRNVISGNNISSNNNVGISLSGSNSNTITGNTITSNNDIGIYLTYSSKNIIEGNIISNNMEGIGLNYESKRNIIVGNTIISNNYEGIFILCYSSSNIIIGNIISDNEWGIYLGSVKISIIARNTISNNKLGINLKDTFMNLILRNNFFYNEKHASFYDSKNILMLNYWNRPRLFPKLILGKINRPRLLPKHILGRFGILSLIPGVNIDWRPALLPIKI